VSYLLHSSGELNRNYATSIASDGIITYSVSNPGNSWREPENSKQWDSASISTNPLPHDAEQSRWVERIFDYLDSITGIRFVRVDNSRGELHFAKVDDNDYFSDYGDGESFTNGYIQWNGWHNRKQYGGLQDIRALQVGIASALGVSRPDGDSLNPSYSRDNTLMSLEEGALNSSGATFFYSEDDQSAIRSILGSNVNSAQAPPATVNHIQEGKEDLLIGKNGQVDIFRLTSKGMILKPDSGTEYDKFGIATINNYNIPYIANFNGQEGDKVFINKKLFSPSTPINPVTLGKNKAPRGLKIRFKQSFSPKQDRKQWVSKANVLYNDAGKLLLNTNGEANNLGPPTIATINDQLVAFIDPIGPENLPFSKQWIGLY
jgi:hypothetical protein